MIRQFLHGGERGFAVETAAQGVGQAAVGLQQQGHEGLLLIDRQPAFQPLPGVAQVRPHGVRGHAEGLADGHRGEPVERPGQHGSLRVRQRREQLDPQSVLLDECGQPVARRVAGPVREPGLLTGEPGRHQPRPRPRIARQRPRAGFAGERFEGRVARRPGFQPGLAEEGHELWVFGAKEPVEPLHPRAPSRAGTSRRRNRCGARRARCNDSVSAPCVAPRVRGTSPWVRHKKSSVTWDLLRWEQPPSVVGWIFGCPRAPQGLAGAAESPPSATPVVLSRARAEKSVDREKTMFDRR